MKKVIIVTVNYETAADTHVLLQSLEKLQVADFSLEIIIVDNGSKDAFVLSQKEKKYTTSIIRLDKNNGFSGGYNIGIKEGIKRNADYILLLNNDTIVDPQLITKLLADGDNNKKIGVTVPKIYFAKGHEFHHDRYKKEELGKVLWYAGGKTDWDNVTSVHRGVDEVDHGQYDTLEIVEFATGCCMLIKRQVFERVGFLDEKYFLYYEDADFSERIKRAGFEIYYVPGAVLAHVNAASSGGAGNDLQDYFMTRNRMLFGMRYAPLRTKLALIRESAQLLLNGRTYQKSAIRDFYLGRFGKGTFFKT